MTMLERQRLQPDMVDLGLRRSAEEGQTLMAWSTTMSERVATRQLGYERRTIH